MTRYPFDAAQPQPPSKPISWDIYRAAAKGKLLGTIEVTDEGEPIEKAAKEFKQEPAKLIAVRRQ